MPKALQPRPGKQSRAPARRRAPLPRELVDEVRRTSRPAQADEALGHLERAVELLAREDFRQGTREAQAAKGLAPRSGGVREVLGLAYYQQERWREALREMQAYRRMTGRVDQNHIIADCYRALGNPERAVPLAEEVLRARLTDDVRAEAVVVAAAALADQGKFDQALALLRRMPTRPDVGRPHDLRLWYVTGDVLARAGRREDAAAEFRRIVRHDQSAFDAAERLAALS